MSSDLAGVAEVATLLGVSKQRINQLAATESFPTPIAKLAAGPVWKRADVIEWARATGRAVFEPDPPQ